jgi:hypothetical protein
MLFDTNVSAESPGPVYRGIFTLLRHDELTNTNFGYIVFNKYYSINKSVINISYGVEHR